MSVLEETFSVTTTANDLGDAGYVAEVTWCRRPLSQKLVWFQVIECVDVVCDFVDAVLVATSSP